jgi:hypothetical protein
MRKRAIKMRLLCAIVILAIVMLACHSETYTPFRDVEVSMICFRYSLMDSTQICVRNRKRIREITETVRLVPKEQCACAHSVEVVFVIGEEEHSAYVCSHCFDLMGETVENYRMPEDFLVYCHSYRDSTHLSERWESPLYLSRQKRAREESRGE